jgi:hypothetical protein
MRAVAVALLVAGCADSGTPPVVPRDLGGGGGPMDLSGSVMDLSGGGGGDGGGGCTMVNTWPSNLLSGGFDPSNGDTFVLAEQQMNEPLNVLALEDWHVGLVTDMGESYPKNVTFSTTGGYLTCDVCLRLLEGCTQASGCMRGYFAQGGTVTVTRADTDPNNGHMTASGSNLTLVEWNFPMADPDGGVTGDSPVPNGRCYNVAHFSFDVAWSPPPDMGGTPDGGMCHPVINEVQTASTTAGTGGNDKWVEIYNPCGTSLTGWKLEYLSASGTTPIPLYTFTAANSNPYLVIAYTSATVEGGVTPDGKWTAGALSKSGGAVALLDSGGKKIDSVGWATVSSSNAYLEGTAAPNPPAGKSIARHPDGADSDVNSADFKVASPPTPRAANP